MAARKPPGKRKLFINLVEDPAHFADQPFVNDKGEQVIITEEEAATLIEWRNSRKVIFKVKGEVYFIPRISEDRCKLIFSVCDVTLPGRTAEDVQLVLTNRRLHSAIDLGMNVDQDEWRALYGFSDAMNALQLDQLVIMSFASGDIHQVVPSHSAHTPLQYAHINRAIQSNPLLQSIQTVQVNDVSVDRLFTILHIFWGEARFKSTLVNYDALQLGVLIVRMPLHRLFEELTLARAELFRYEQEERLLEQHISTKSITSKEEEEDED